MNLVNFLEKLQRKPREAKIQIMWIGSILCLIFIFAFWIWSLNDIIAQSKAENEDQKLKAGLEQFAKDVPTIWSTLGAGIGGVFDSLAGDLINSPSNEIPPEYWTESESLPLE